MKQCKKCGYKAVKDENFCPDCGQKMIQLESEDNKEISESKNTSFDASLDGENSNIVD